MKKWFLFLIVCGGGLYVAVQSHKPGDDEALQAWFLMGLVGALYFAPTFLALSRNSPDVLAIFVVNLVFGWTFLGYMVALVWACKGTKTTVLFDRKQLAEIQTDMERRRLQ